MPKTENIQVREAAGCYYVNVFVKPTLAELTTEYEGIGASLGEAFQDIADQLLDHGI